MVRVLGDYLSFAPRSSPPFLSFIRFWKEIIISGTNNSLFLSYVGLVFGTIRKKKRFFITLNIIRFNIVHLLDHPRSSLETGKKMHWLLFCSLFVILGSPAYSAPLSSLADKSVSRKRATTTVNQQTLCTQRPTIKKMKSSPSPFFHAK